MASETETTGPIAGALVFTDNNEIVRRGVKASENIAVGDPVTFDTNGFVQKASNTVGNRAQGLGVAKQAGNNSTGSDGDISIQVIMGNTYVGFTLGGVVKPFNLVKLNATFKAVAHTNPANATTPTAGEVDAVRDYYGLAFGRYYGHFKEEKEPTDGADTDIGVIRLGVD
jgi:hypothetical protein